MNKVDVVQALLGQALHNHPVASATGFAPTNIALAKYWGKRDQTLNLPVTSSLSVSLANLGATTTIATSQKDCITLNNKPIELSTPFATRLISFLDLFRRQQPLQIAIEANIPIAAGLASSACGFASVVKTLNQFYQWNLSTQALSILARLGSGSASRSLWDGFVIWHAGSQADGMDSHGELLPETWPDLCVGLLLLDEKEKSISSRAAMQQTIATSVFYKAWPEKVAEDLSLIKQAIAGRNFQQLGQAAESNALAMHATMLTAWPPICYTTPETLAMMQKIWKLRADGLPVYFTQDAGPNLKLLFLEKDASHVQTVFPGLVLIKPFRGSWGGQSVFCVSTNLKPTLI